MTASSLSRPSGGAAGGTPSSRRKPWPWHIQMQIGSSPRVGLIVREGLIGKRVLPLANYQAPVQEEETGDLYRERSYTFRRFYLGFGDATQQSNAPPTRYFFGKNAWHFGAFRGLGPRLRDCAPGATEGEVRGAVEAEHQVGANAPVTRWFVMAGRYVRRWDGDTGGEQAQSVDFGAGRQIGNWARWTAGGPGARDALYVTVTQPASATPGLGDLWRYQGGQWTNLTAGGAPDAAFVLATGPELWRACGTPEHPSVPYAVSKCEADPTIPANWTSPIRVGDASVPITGMGEIGMRLYIFKADGTVWALQGGIDTGTARNLTPDLRETARPENGRLPHPWLGSLYFRIGESLWRFDGTQAMRAGPERLIDNTSPLRGPVGAFHGFGAWYGFASLYNSSEQASYVLQYGQWLPEDAQGPTPQAGRFVPSWNGSLLDLAGKRVTALVVTEHPSVIGQGPDGGNPLLLVGYGDGGYGWLKLPRDGPSPFSEDAHLAPEDFTDQESWTRFPRHTLMAPGDLKAYLAFNATGPVLDAARHVRIQYRVDPVGSATPWVTLAEPLAGSGEPHLLPDDTTGKIIDIRECYRVIQPATVPDPEFAKLATPVVATTTLREQLRPAFRLEYAFTILAHDRVARRDGASDRRTAQQIRNLLVEATQLPGHVILTLPDETVGRFAVIEFQEQIPPDGRFRRRGMAWDLTVSCIQYRTVSPYGRWYRFFGARWQDLNGITWQETRTL